MEQEKGKKEQKRRKNGGNRKSSERKLPPYIKKKNQEELREGGRLQGRAKSSKETTANYTNTGRVYWGPQNRK